VAADKEIMRIYGKLKMKVCYRPLGIWGEVVVLEFYSCSFWVGEEIGPTLISLST